MKMKNTKYLPVLLFAEEHFIVNDLGRLNSMYCRMKDGNYVRSYYEKLGGNIQQEIITKELFESKKCLQIQN
jgi:hypothetical protein